MLLHVTFFAFKAGILGSYQANYSWNMYYKSINDVNTKIAGVEASSLAEDVKNKFIAELD